MTIRDSVRVLIVEDDLTIASFLVKGFKEAGFAVDHAPDGESGLHMASTQPYDVAIVDLMLPKLDGLTVIQRLREQKHPNAGHHPQRAAYGRRSSEGARNRW